MPRIFQRTHLARWLLTVTALSLLAACTRPYPPPAPGFDYLATVETEPGSSEAELEALYGGSCVLFDPEAGFAVLGFSEVEAGRTSLALSKNRAVFSAPELKTQGAGAWAHGARAWADGAGAWADGARAWADGAGAWADGERFGTPLDNYGAWEQIGLYEAHTKLAPRLGEGVVVAVIDTGLDLKHPVFGNRLVPGWDFIDDDALPQDEGEGLNYGHGTAVAGVVLQVAPRTKIMPLRILNAEGSGDTDDLVLAMNWAVTNGADVINISLGSSTDNWAVRKMLAKARAHGVAVVTSSGNSGDENVTFPARDAANGEDYAYGLVSVGSVNGNDEKSSFSTYGEERVETVAPGEAVFTAYPDKRVIYWSGTSFAAPMVSGALALALAESSLDKTPEELPQLVTENVMDDLYDIAANSGALKDQLGEGRLDLREFLGDVLDP